MKLTKKNIKHKKTITYLGGTGSINIPFIIFLLCVFIFYTGSVNLYAQKAKKNKARINAQYVKTMDGEIYFNIKASSRIKKKTVPLANIELTIYNEFDDERVELGKTITNDDGENKFSLTGLDLIKPDSSKTYHIQFLFKGNDDFKKAKRNISFKDATIKAKIISKDSINYISATLIDTETKDPIADESLTVFVQRLFKPLTIGKEFNNTSDEGSILVPIPNGIPGVDGNITVEVVLNESDDYGTVKAIVKAPIGVPIADESTFNQRTMWSPRNKTPVFLLIFPNILIFGIWGFIIYLILNLFKLSKS